MQALVRIIVRSLLYFTTISFISFSCRRKPVAITVLYAILRPLIGWKLRLPNKNAEGRWTKGENSKSTLYTIIQTHQIKRRLLVNR